MVLGMHYVHHIKTWDFYRTTSVKLPPQRIKFPRINGVWRDLPQYRDESRCI